MPLKTAFGILLTINLLLICFFLSVYNNNILITQTVPTTQTLSNGSAALDYKCPIVPPNLVGPIEIDKSSTNLDILNSRYFPTRVGGHFKPVGCEARSKTAIIVAYRDRHEHLMMFLNNLIPFLNKQQLEFTIFVVEPVQTLTFNRALLMNVGFVEALKTDNVTCFVFHDVDLIPVNDHNMYRCEDKPRHMSVANSKFKYQLPYGAYVGGVVAISRSIYEDINGQSNLFFGWGGEDDDLYARLQRKKHKTIRHSVITGRYEALDHKKDKGNPSNPKRMELLNAKSHKKNYTASDGLDTLKYTIVKKEEKQLYTWILIDLDMNYYNAKISEELKKRQNW